MNRRDAIDRIRGLAVLLMVVGHVLAVTDSGLLVRLTLTRASLPLFALVTGYLLADREPSNRRTLQLAGGAAVSLWLVRFLPGMAAVDVLAVIGIALAFWPLALRWPVVTLCVGAVQGYTFAGFFDGYQPGHVMALMCAGLLLRRGGSVPDLAVARRVASALPGWVAGIGRRPLTVYVGHLAVLAVAVRAGLLL